jgi:hypothetical protein
MLEEMGNMRSVVSRAKACGMQRCSLVGGVELRRCKE